MKKTVLHLILMLLPLMAICQSPPTILADNSVEQLPLDGIVERKVLRERRVLEYPSLRENDLLWEKKVWRLIDTREKMNQAFRYPQKYFFEILTEGIEKGTIRAYSAESDDFSFPLKPEEALSDLQQIDTLPIINPETFEESLQVVVNSLDPAKVIRYRIKEVWYFDKTHGTLKTRILGIAPMITERDEMGNFKFERPMFWVYYPDCREWLSKYPFFNDHTDKQESSWEDLFEMRRFASYITKESNVLDERLEDQLSGIDRLMRADQINQEIFNYEFDLWSN
ncbi:MAG: gliding motility protein GldN [Saprospiraceae bacterium]|nr:gliding motility protein GldN [Lewinella sp.]